MPQQKEEEDDVLKNWYPLDEPAPEVRRPYISAPTGDTQVDANWYTTTPPPKPIEMRAGEAVQHGIGQVVENFGGGLGWLGRVTVGDTWGEDIVKTGKQMQVPGVSRSIEDVRSARDLMNWAVNSFMEQSPQFAGTVAMRGIGAGAGAVGAGLLGRGLPATQRMIAAGGASGMIGWSAMQNFGESMLGFKEQGIDDDKAALLAGAVGPLKVVADIIEPTRQAGKIGIIWKDKLDLITKQGLAKTIGRGAAAVGRETLTGMKHEGLTESWQDILDIAGEQAARDWVASQKGIPSTSPGFARTLARIANAGAAGAVTGGATAGMIQTVEEVQKARKAWTPPEFDPEEVATELRPRNRNQVRTEQNTNPPPPGSQPPLHSTPVVPGTGTVPIDPGTTAPEPPTDAGPPPPPAKRVWEMDRAELTEAEKAARAQDNIALDNIFGPDGAKRYKSLDRIRNISSDPARVEKAQQEIDLMEDGLSPEQLDLLHGVGLPDEQNHEVLQQYKNAVDNMDFTTPLDLGNSLRFAVTSFRPELDPQDMSTAERVAYYQIRTAMDYAQSKGWNTEEVSGHALMASAARFTDPKDAQFMISSLAAAWKQGKMARPSGPALPAPVQPDVYLDEPEQRQTQEEIGEELWTQIPDAISIGQYPIVDSEGFFSEGEQSRLADDLHFTFGSGSGTSVDSVTDYLKLAEQLLKRMVHVGAQVLGISPLSPMDRKLALQISPGANHVQLGAGTGGKWLFAVHPLQAGGAIGLEDATWDQLQNQVVYALNDGRSDNIAANEAKIKKALEPYKSAYMKRFSDMRTMTPVVAALLKLEQVFGQREQFMGGIDPWYKTIRLSFDPARQEGMSRYEYASALTRQSVENAPRTTGSGTRVLAPSNVKLTPSILGNRLLNRFGEGINRVTEEVIRRLGQVIQRYQEIAPHFDGASILLPYRAHPMVHYGQWWSASKNMSKFTVSSNPFGPMVRWPEGTGPQATPSPQQSGNRLLENIIHETVHASVIGHGPQFTQMFQEVTDALNQMGMDDLRDLLTSLYANPTRPSEFNPELYRLYEEIAAQYSAGFLAKPEEIGPAGPSNQPGGTSTGGAGPGPQLGGGWTSITPEIGEPAVPGPAGEETGDAAGGDWPDSSGTAPTGGRSVFDELGITEGDRQAWEQEPLAPEVQAMVGLMQAAGIPPQQQKNVVNYHRVGSWFLSLIQIGERNPLVEAYQRYLQKVRDWWKKKTEITMRADRDLREWMKLGGRWGIGKWGKIASEYLLTVSQQSEQKRRRLTQAEKGAIATQLNAHPDVVKFAEKIWDSLRNVLNRMEQAIKDHVERTILGEVGTPGGPRDQTIAKALIAGRHADITKQYDRLRRRDYFPFSRFGRYGVVVKALKPIRYRGRIYAKGRNFIFETKENETEGLLLFKDLEHQWKGNSAVEVKTVFLTEEDYVWSGFPPSLYEDLRITLGLPPQMSETLREVYLSRSPGSGFVKHLKKRRGVAGFSQDAMRAYADYMMHASNHLARVEHGWELTAAIKDMDKFIPTVQDPREAYRAGQLKDYMSRHFTYLMNPTGDMGALRGWIFNWYFAYVPKQALVNLMQIPMFTFPHLAKKYGVAGATRELVRAYKDVTAQYYYDKFKKGKRVLTPDEDQLVGRGQEAGFLDESFATQVAGMAEGGISAKFLPSKIFGRRIRGSNPQYYVKNALEFGTLFFRLTENYDRRVSYLATVRLAKRAGEDLDGQFRAGRDAVESTMFEYARWNRPEIMRNQRAILFVFQNYLQHALYFTWMNKGNIWFWAAMLPIVGLKGIPGAETGEELINLLITKFKEFAKMKNPYFNLEDETREYLSQLGANPDLFIDGASKYGFGLTMLQWAGVPVPNMDYSSSVQLGKIAPVVGPMAQKFQGSKEWKDTVIDIMSELIGASGTTGANILKGVFDPSVEGINMFRLITPAVFRNAMDAWTALRHEEHRNSRGEKLVDVDIHDPRQFMEVIATFLGAPATRKRQAQEYWASIAQEQIYYNSRKEKLLANYAEAVSERDNREGIAEAVKEIDLFNRTSPPDFTITTDAMSESSRSRGRREALRERGLPPEKRYIQLHKRAREAYPNAPYPPIP